MKQETDLGSPRRWVVNSGFALCFALLLMTATPPRIRALEPGQPIDRELAKGEIHFYQLPLAAGQYVSVALSQLRISASLRLWGPDSRLRANVTDWVEGSKYLSWAAETAGNYRLEIYSNDRRTAARRYRVSIEELRPATARDHRRVAAQQTFAAARELYSTGDAQSRRDALPKFREALALWRELDDQRQQAAALMDLAVTHTELSEYQLALDYGQQALQLRAAADRDWEARVFNYLGEAHHYLGEYQQALAAYEQALPFWRAIGHLPGEAWTLNDMGSAFNAIGERQRALDYYEQSLRVYQAANDVEGQALELTKLGAFHASLGEMEKALELLQQAKRFWQGRNDPRQARTWHSLGDLYAARGERQTAMEHYGQALERWRATGDRYWESITLHGLGCAAMAAGEWQRATEDFSQSLRLRRNIGDRRGQAATLTHLGATLYSSGDTRQALESYHEALVLCREIGDREGEAGALYQLARLARDGNRMNEARDRIKGAIRLVEQVRANFLSQEMRAAYLATIRDYYEFYIDLLMMQDKRQSSGGFAAQALQISERARARSLLELLAEAGANIRQGAEPRLAARERVIEQQFSAAIARRVRLLSTKAPPAQIAAVDTEIAALDDRQRQIEAQLRAASPAYAALTAPRPLSTSELQRQTLDAGTLLLEYSLGEEQSHLWVLTQAKLTAYRLPKRAEIEAAAQPVRQLLTTPGQWPRSETGELLCPPAAAKLSQMLLGPAAALLSNKRLLIVASGVLQYIPFAALPVPATEQPGYQPLIADHEIVSLPSASVLALLRRELAARPSAPRTLAVLADPVFSVTDERVRGGKSQLAASARWAAPPRDVERAWEEVNGGDGKPLDRLLDTEWEAQKITEIVPVEQQFKALGFDASRVTAISGVLSQYRILHFATHALVSNRPELTGLLLSLVDKQGRSLEGFLPAHEILNLKLPADLVVLSACRTALGKEVKGEGIVGLTRSFMYAGALRVVASLWSVADKESADLMVKFYQHLLGPERLSATAALRAAQIEMWKKGQKPYYWAAFVLQGEWK